MPPTIDIGLRRFLVPFRFRQVPLYQFDLVVVGGGAAGSAAALAAAEQGAWVAVLAKGELIESNTRYAQGGMAAVLSTADSFRAHVEDTLRVGCGLCSRATVEAVVADGPRVVSGLLEIGTHFDRNPRGELLLSREGGHTNPRIIHANGDATGLEMQRALTKAVESHPRITVFPHTFAIELLSDDAESVLGVLARTRRGELVTFATPRVILASGGAGQVYRETTNPVIATGDGVAMGFRAGARVRDPEFVQFHPTCLYIAGAARVLISEVVRGAGGVLRDRHGARFMPDYHPDADLAPRDVVSRAVFARMVETGDTNVYLDLSEIDGDPHSLFPGISRICGVFGIDIGKDPVPVRPGAHYMIGGLEVDLDGRTSVPGLWAVGECGSTGLHGANRMGSNSLLEAMVLGLRAGRCAAMSAGHVEVGALEHVNGTAQAPARPEHVNVNIVDMTYSLKSLMWRQMGVQRERARLEDALEKIAFWSRAVADLAPPEPASWELLNMLTVARLAAWGALEREESRGVHYRLDFPATREELRCHTVIRPVLDRELVLSIRLEHVPVETPVGTP